MRVLAMVGLAAVLYAAWDRPVLAQDCDNAATQAVINQCAAEFYRREDGALNQTYQAVMARLDPAGQSALRQAQRDWLKYRDSHCQAVASAVRGGSLYGAVINGCLAETTKARADTLKAMMPAQ